MTLFNKDSYRLNHFSVRTFIYNSRKLFINSWKLILVPTGVGALLFLGIFSLRHVLPFSPDVFTRDPLATAKLPFFYGIFSNLGVMLWASTAAVNFLCAAFMGKNDKIFRFMLFSGVLNIWLALDDLLQLHELVLPQYLHISEVITYMIYLFSLAAYLIFFKNEIYLHSNYLILITALLGFVFSVLVDFIWGITIIEDGAKFLGILLWSIYFFNTTKSFIAMRINQEKIGLP